MGREGSRWREDDREGAAVGSIVFSICFDTVDNRIVWLYAGRKTVVDGLFLVVDPPPLSAVAHLTEISGHLESPYGAFSYSATILNTASWKQANLSVYLPVLSLTFMRE